MLLLDEGLLLGSFLSRFPSPKCMTEAARMPPGIEWWSLRK